MSLGEEGEEEQDLVNQKKVQLKALSHQLLALEGGVLLSKCAPPCQTLNMSSTPCPTPYFSILCLLDILHSTVSQGHIQEGMWDLTCSLMVVQVSPGNAGVHGSQWAGAIRI